MKFLKATLVSVKETLKFLKEIVSRNVLLAKNEMMLPEIVSRLLPLASLTRSLKATPAFARDCSRSLKEIVSPNVPLAKNEKMLPEIVSHLLLHVVRMKKIATEDVDASPALTDLTGNVLQDVARVRPEIGILESVKNLVVGGGDCSQAFV
jgi:hypothetical protein